MTNFKNTLLTLTLLASAPLFCAERPPQAPKLPTAFESQDSNYIRQRITGLPAELQREILNTYFFQAYPNSHAMAQRIIAFKDKITAESMLRLLENIRLYTTVIDLAELLKELPVMQDKKIKDWLLKVNARVETARNNTRYLHSLMVTIEQPGQREKIFEVLKNKEVYLNWIRPVNNTFLINAIRMGDAEIVASLLAQGADPDLKDANGLEWPPLMIATDRGLTDIIKLLITAHANVNIQDHHGYTPLIHAASLGNSEIVQLFLDAGADLDIENYKGETALKIAQRKGNTQIVKLIEQAAVERKAKQLEKK